MPPDVIARVRYYEVGAAKRAFYGSGQKDDYLGYIDKGVQSASKSTFVLEIGYRQVSGYKLLKTHLIFVIAICLYSALKTRITITQLHTRL